jgi:hypothetical protein
MNLHRDEQPLPVPPTRVVQVEIRKYVELLVSRRKLERVFEKADQLRDRDTDEIFVLDAESVAWMAKGA